jgi:hypothetical protein
VFECVSFFPCFPTQAVLILFLGLVEVLAPTALFQRDSFPAIARLVVFRPEFFVRHEISLFFSQSSQLTSSQMTDLAAQISAAVAKQLQSAVPGLKKAALEGRISELRGKIKEDLVKASRAPTSPSRSTSSR